jgi:two-component system, cell cycle response regulator
MISPGPVSALSSHDPGRECGGPGVRVLIAEDESATRRLLEATLRRWGYAVCVACDGEQAWKLLETEGGPRLAILDGEMPGMDGVEVCRLVRTLPADRYVYCILLTSRSHKEEVARGLDSGADDYLSKPFEPVELRARVRVGSRTLALHADLIAAREALRIQATHDGLTGVLNRGAVLDALSRELGRSSRQGSSLGLLLVDVDHFKHVNDTFGHAAGDAVLREVTRRLGEGVRPYDVLGRLGGEEFLLVLPDCNALETLRLGERLRLRLSAEPICYGGESIAVTVSIGAAIRGPDGLSTAESLIQSADEALYRAKRGGRDRVEAAIPVLA